MTPRSEERMRAYWDERARLNAAWYVDTSLRYEGPDMQQFFATGQRVVSEALDDVPIELSGTALAVEIGSGLGRVCAALTGRFDRVIGIDISSEMVERARSLVPDERIEFMVGDGTTLAPIPDEGADLVISFTVFQHIPKVRVIERYIAEAGRILKPGGLFVFQWNNTPGSLPWAARRVALALGQRIGIGRERFGRNDPNFLGSRVSLPKIKRVLEANGMQLQRVKGQGELFAFAWASRSA